MAVDPLDPKWQIKISFFHITFQSSFCIHLVLLRRDFLEKKSFNKSKMAAGMKKLVLAAILDFVK
jgi:hypothetical protein